MKGTAFIRSTTHLRPLDQLAGKTRVMEDEFLNAAGTDVTDALRLYLPAAAGFGHAGCVPAARSQRAEDTEEVAADGV
jgi:hypothetical protein